MKSIIQTIIMFIIVQSTIAQNNVGIGTNTPNASAKLDIIDANKGLLIPRVSLTASNVAGPVTSPAISLLVYNEATNGTAPNNVSPGYYYWDGGKWVKIMVNNNNTIDVGYILGWTSNTAPPDYLLPLNGVLENKLKGNYFDVKINNNIKYSKYFSQTILLKVSKDKFEENQIAEFYQIPKDIDITESKFKSNDIKQIFII